MPVIAFVRGHRWRLLPVLIVLATPLCAQESTSLSDVVPEAPAFTFLGANPTKVNHPYTPRDLAANLLSAVDSTGKLRQGFALGVTPWYLIPGIRISPEDYATNRLKYMLAWTQLSLGTVRASGDSASTDLSLGLRVTVFDGGDPWTDSDFLPKAREAITGCSVVRSDSTGMTEEERETAVAERAACLDRTLPDSACRARFTVGTEVSSTELTAIRDARQKCIRKGMKGLREEWEKSHGNVTSLSFGLATGWRFNESRVSDRDNLGMSLWVAGGWRHQKKFRLIGQLQYDYRSAPDSQSSNKALTYGARAALGSDRLNSFIELTGNRRFDAPQDVDKGKGSWSWGIEARIADNTWLSTGLGSTFDNQDAPDRVVVVANIRWGISGKGRLAHFVE